MKKVLKGILGMMVFYIFNMFIMQIIGQFIFVGDPVTLSYHLFTYTGLMTLCAVIIVCTYIIIEKLNEVKAEVNKSKNT
ncbi:hypothetical protein [Clostridium tertium]|uniref:Uncharacterized protein n=1 Tax=Clostridium tertium TaxID=1559 RepID=A0A6N3DTT8_9CLOT